MHTVNRMFYLAILAYCIVAPVAVLAQTCNPNISLSTPTSEFTDHGDGTVTHHRTGLVWKKCLEGQSGEDCSGAPTLMTWSQALTHARSHEFAGSSVWRLPNIKELTSIVEEACFFPALNVSIFPDEPGSDVWTSSPYANYSYYAWYVYFGYGYSHNYGKSNGTNVRLVRDEGR